MRPQGHPGAMGRTRQVPVAPGSTGGRGLTPEVRVRSDSCHLVHNYSLFIRHRQVMSGRNTSQVQIRTITGGQGDVFDRPCSEPFLRDLSPCPNTD